MDYLAFATAVIELCQAATRDTAGGYEGLDQLNYNQCLMGIHQILHMLTARNKSQSSARLEPGDILVSSQSSTNPSSPTIDRAVRSDTSSMPAGFNDRLRETGRAPPLMRCSDTTTASPTDLLGGVQCHAALLNNPFLAESYQTSRFGSRQDRIGPSRPSMPLGSPGVPLRRRTAPLAGPGHAASLNGIYTGQMSPPAKRR